MHIKEAIPNLESWCRSQHLFFNLYKVMRINSRYCRLAIQVPRGKFIAIQQQPSFIQISPLQDYTLTSLVVSPITHLNMVTCLLLRYFKKPKLHI